MAECALCYKQDIPEKNVYSFYTAIEYKTTYHTGIKEYEIQTKRFAFKRHTCYVCDDCVSKNKRQCWLTVLGILVVAVFGIMVIRSSDDPSWVFLFIPVVGYIGYLLFKRFVIMTQLMKLGVKERDFTNWEDDAQLEFNQLMKNIHEFPLVGEESKIVALSEAEYLSTQTS